MEELLVKYSFGECSPAELLEVELLFKQHPELKQDALNMVKLDEILASDIAPIGVLRHDFENKLTSLLQQELTSKPRPQMVKELIQPINLNELDQKSKWEDYLAPILFALASFVFVLTYGINSNTNQSEIASMFSNYSTTILLASVCLLGFFFLDQMLGKKQDTRNFVLCL